MKSIACFNNRYGTGMVLLTNYLLPRYWTVISTLQNMLGNFCG